MSTTFPTAAPPQRGRTTIVVVAVAMVTALALVFFMVSSVTNAAWTDTTRNDDNAWQTGHLDLTDDDGGVAMFRTAEDGLMVPGTTLTKSIEVENASDVPLDVDIYAANLTGNVELPTYLNLRIGTNADVSGTTPGNVYNGTLADFASNHAAFNLADAAPLAVGTTSIYYFWVQLDASAPGNADPQSRPSVEGVTAGVDFVWEGQTQAQ